MPDEAQQPEQEPRYYMARPGRGSKKPKSLSEWNRRERFLRFFARSAGYRPPPPWLN
jgi:hypothetical protein